jgi:sec-independent protein translocase protein TatB
MFEVGFSEILLIFGIALLVLGPERLPKLAADVGRWAGRARAMARQLRTQLEQEVHFDPLVETTGGSRQPAPVPHTIQPPEPAPAAIDAPAASVEPPTLEPAPALTPPVATAEAHADAAAPEASAQTIPDEPKPG